MLVLANSAWCNHYQNDSDDQTPAVSAWGLYKYDSEKLLHGRYVMLVIQSMCLVSNKWVYYKDWIDELRPVYAEVKWSLSNLGICKIPGNSNKSSPHLNHFKIVSLEDTKFHRDKLLRAFYLLSNQHQKRYRLSQTTQRIREIVNSFYPRESMRMPSAWVFDNIPSARRETIPILCFTPL